jgi:mannose-1-phosphate guanylyltransferase/mannose-6-phosphate isomerase
MTARLHGVILAGGSGIRFWPLSRRARPKQFLRVSGPRTLLQASAERLRPLIDPERTWVVCGAAHAGAVAADLPDLPPEAILAILPADHHVEDEAAFRDALALAAKGARAGHIVTLGITPTRPETGYGWIERGAPLGLDDDEALCAVAAFVEKPERARAEALLAGGRHLWNAGVFVFAAGTMLEELEAHLPGVAGPLRVLERDPADRAALEAAWAEVERISIDHGVMERTRRAACVPVRCGWSDVGSLASLRALGERDEADNRLEGDALAVASRACLVHAAGGRPVVVVGVEGLCVVDTGDAVLVVPEDRAQWVREAVAALEAAGREEVL